MFRFREFCMAKEPYAALTSVAPPVQAPLEMLGPGFVFAKWGTFKRPGAGAAQRTVAPGRLRGCLIYTVGCPEDCPLTIRMAVLRGAAQRMISNSTGSA